MRLRKILLWTGGGFAGLLALAYAGLAYWAWVDDERFESVLVFENRSGQPLHDLAISHNGEVVYQTRGLDPQRALALSQLNPLKGPGARPRRGDIYQMEATATVAFRREPAGREERHEFDAGGHSDIFLYKCLFTVSVTPQSIATSKCIEIKLPKKQYKPKG